MKQKKLAIIGAASGQLPLCLKAKELGLETHCFAYDQGAVCKEVVDFFYPISILEKDTIVKKCKEIGIDGVVSNASDLTAEVVAYVAGQLDLVGPSYNTLLKLHDKFWVRELTQTIPMLNSPRYYVYQGIDQHLYPCVVKPCVGGAKKGVSYVSGPKHLMEAIVYATVPQTGILVEEYIEGKELSIETISFQGEHYILQVTDKDSSAAPHFVELGHHQPAQIPSIIQQKIYQVIPSLLTSIGYDNGAAHVEIKYRGDQLFLIEVNLRGGGDNISNLLVKLSSGHDYLKYMIEVALNCFTQPHPTSSASYAGIYYLCQQTAELLPFFQIAKGKEWVIDEKIDSIDLQESHSNYERNGYLIYQSSHKVVPGNLSYE